MSSKHFKFLPRQLHRSYVLYRIVFSSKFSGKPWTNLSKDIINTCSLNRSGEIPAQCRSDRFTYTSGCCFDKSSIILRYTDNGLVCRLWLEAARYGSILWHVLRCSSQSPRLSDFKYSALYPPSPNTITKVVLFFYLWSCLWSALSYCKLSCQNHLKMPHPVPMLSLKVMNLTESLPQSIWAYW